MNNFFNIFTSPQLSLCISNSSGLRSDHEQLTWYSLSNDAADIQQQHHFDTNSQNDSYCRVAIILGYYNGNTYLSEQIRSILDQSHNNFELFISDDCSDSKVDIDRLGLSPIETQKLRFGFRSRNAGFTNNFLGALSSINDSFEYFAFSDQDDVWYHSKLKDALTILGQHPKDKPALYCARTAITDETCQADLGTSPLFDKPPSFANALVQSIGGGNTMVFNKAARDLIVTSSVDTDVVSHDWWCYQIVSGAGGMVHYDPKPCLKYRQHSNNLFGSNNSWAARLIRIRWLLRGTFKNWNGINLAALAKNKQLLTSKNQSCLEDFITACESGLIKRLFLFKRSGIYRQTLLGNLGLLFGLLINKV